MSDGTLSLSLDPTAADPGRTGGVQAPAGALKPPQAPDLAKPAKGDSLTLSPEAKALVAKLQARDTAVKAHEGAHIAAGAGIVTSGASYTYEKGPDGRNYAVGGEVSIDSSPVKGNPQATLAKALQIEASALAPADPSAQDQAVAAGAAAMASEASAELAAKGASAGQSTGKAASGTGQPQDGAQAVTGTNENPTAKGSSGTQAGLGTTATATNAYGAAGTQPGVKQGGRNAGAGSLFDAVG